MKTINLTRGKVALIDDADYEELSKNSWSYSSTGYAQRGFKVSGKCKTVLMHRQLLRAPCGIEIDHINGNRLDNRRSNLRFATRGENSFNQRKQRRQTTSRYKGVYWHKGDNLGNYQSEPEAAIAYNNAAIKYHGEYAKINQFKEENSNG